MGDGVANAAAMDRFRRPGTLRSLELGSLRVSFVPDGVVKMVPSMLFPGTSPEDWADHRFLLDDSGWLTVTSGGLLVEAGERALLIDAGYGPDSVARSLPEAGIAEMYGGGLLPNLARLGRRPADLDAIAITHLHMEHVGWAAHPAFAGATYLVSETEWQTRHAAPGVSDEVIGAIEQRFRPIAAGELALPGVRCTALPGHTAGQIGFSIESQGQRLLAFADAFHSPVQIMNPDWPLMGDPDPGESMRTRRSVLDLLAEPAVTGFGIHFADVVFGTVGRTGPGHAWAPLG